MEKIETYDIITLEDNTEYTVLKIVQEEGKKYYLLAPVNEEEEPNLEELQIAEESIENGKIIIEEIKDEKTLNHLSKMFLSALSESLD